MLIRIVLVVVCFVILGIFLMLQEYRLVRGDLCGGVGDDEVESPCAIQWTLLTLTCYGQQLCCLVACGVGSDPGACLKAS